MRILLFLLLLPAFLSAQSFRYLNDADIVWVKLLEQDWLVDDIKGESPGSEIATLKFLKTELNSQFYDWDYLLLGMLVLPAAEAGKLPIYSDPACTIPADPKATLSQIDTFHTFSPDTFEDTLIINNWGHSPFEITGWRVRQILAYHKKSAAWSTSVESVAPLIERHVDRNNSDEKITIPLFWFKADQHHQNIGKDKIVWAKKIDSWMHCIDIPNNDLIKVAAGFEDPIFHQFTMLKTNKKIPFYNYNYPGGHVMTMKERLKWHAYPDSTTTFEAKTRSVNQKIVMIDDYFDPAYRRFIRLSQNWYWDEKNSRLSIALNGTSAYSGGSVGDGKLRFEQVLFYRHPAKLRTR